jgi:hypothetical protein
MSSYTEFFLVELNKCIYKYQQFIDTISENVSDDFVRLGNLVKCDKLSGFDNDIEFTKALHDLSDKCYRITNKKSQYYVHKYNPDFVIDLVKDLENKDEILEAFDLTPSDNCCNCVSFVCYSTGKINLLFDYLYSMKKSLDNITRCLEGFIARYYFDPSIFEVIYQNYISTDPALKNLAIDCYKLLKYILVNPRAETYIYFCKMIIEGLPISKIRTLRFLPMFESDVNISVIREADGFVSYLDCHNIKLFQRVNKISMIYNFSSVFSLTYKTFEYNQIENYTIHYSNWLNIFAFKKYLYIKHPTNKEIYSKYIEDNYNKDFIITESIIKNYNQYNNKLFMNYVKLFDILAGTIALRVKFSNQYLIRKINFINEIINFSNKEYKNEFDNYSNLLFSGYDEILLCELFEPLITLNKKIINLEKYKNEKEESIIKKIKKTKDDILNMFILIENNDTVIYEFEKNSGINHDFKKNITGIKICLDGHVSDYTFEEICRPSYIEEKDFYDINNLYKILPWIKYMIVNKIYGYLIDYIIDLAYSKQYLKDNYKDYFYNIGLNLLNKKFFNIDEKLLLQSNNQELEYFTEVYKQLNTFYNNVYPPSYPEPVINIREVLDQNDNLDFVNNVEVSNYNNNPLSSNIEHFIKKKNNIYEKAHQKYPIHLPESIIDYKLKYLKYKEKYLKLKYKK